eukprot:553264_1
MTASWEDIRDRLDNIDLLIWAVIALTCILCCLCGLACGICLQRKLTKDKIHELNLAQHLTLRSSSICVSSSQPSEATLQPPSSSISRFPDPLSQFTTISKIQISTKPTGSSAHQLQDSLSMWDNPVYNSPTNTNMSVTIPIVHPTHGTTSQKQMYSATPVHVASRLGNVSRSTLPPPPSATPMRRIQSTPVHPPRQSVPMQQFQRMRSAPIDDRDVPQVPNNRMDHKLQQAFHILAEDAKNLQHSNHEHTWTDMSLGSARTIQMQPKSLGIVGDMGMFDNNSDAESIQSY